MKAIFFHAPWCPSCHPTLDKIRPLWERTTKYRSIEFEEVDVGTEEGAARAVPYGIIALPTMIFENDFGEETDRIASAISAWDVEQKLGKLLGNP